MFDTSCYNLALHWLEDEPLRTQEEREARAIGLAQAIQDAIEGWLEDNPQHHNLDEELNRLDS
jgi:hypothetical protein